MEVASLRVMGRNTQGVKLINLRSDDAIAAVAKVSASKEEENMDNEENAPENEPEADTSNE